MAHVQITMLEGRTAEQKHRAAKRVTEVLREELNVRPEKLTIAFVEGKKRQHRLQAAKDAASNCAVSSM